jgi:hypothetical protein
LLIPAKVFHCRFTHGTRAYPTNGSEIIGFAARG